MSRDLAQGIRGYGVPYVPTPNIKISLLIENLNLKKGDLFIDIGCGDGIILEAVKKQFPEARVIGYEKSYRPYLDAIKKREKNGLDYEIRNEDFFLAGIKEANVLYSYMISYMMEKIWSKINSDCRDGTILISSSFPISSKLPKTTLNVGGNKNLFIYEVEKKRVP
ncbi:MAG: protein-lysine N-methyltransferase [Candidatus Altimarinota bacterium]